VRQPPARPGRHLPLPLRPDRARIGDRRDRAGRDWFYAPAGQRQARPRVVTRLPGYCRHNSAAARALARHLRGEGFQSVDIDPGDPGAADFIVAWDATQGQAFDPSPLRDW
jgi:hypothetical protein